MSPVKFDKSVKFTMGGGVVYDHFVLTRDSDK